jgi:hypothetical protein
VTNATSQAIAGATVRTFHHEDNEWLLDYETTTDVNGNYEIPADAGVEVVVAAYKTGYLTSYYDGANSFETAETVEPINREELQGIDFELVED